MKILFLVPHPLKKSPSQRFRFEQYFKILLTAGHTYEAHSFLSPDHGRIFFENGKFLIKAWALFQGFMRRLILLSRVSHFEMVFIHREAAPLGPPVLEWLIARILYKRIIFDFDDAVWLTDKIDERWWVKAVKWRKKVRSLCKWSYKVSCGNDYLCQYARQFNQRVIYNPTTVDTNSFQSSNKTEKKQTDEFVIGWTGSHTTLKYLNMLEEPLRALEEKYPQIRIMIIADQPPHFSLRSIDFVPWSEKTEVEYLLTIDIGIMPLPDNDWSRGKCGFKALQYMSLEKPALVSPVGVNTRVVDHGINGFHCSTPLEWFSCIEYLIERRDICREMGKLGKEKVVEHYSIVSNTPNFLSLFE